MLTKLHHSPVRAAILAMVLPGVAGAVNATGFLEVGIYTSHVTGNVARAGIELAESHRDQALLAAGAVGFFLLGVIFAAVMVEFARRQERARYSIPLLVEALVLSALMGTTELHLSQRVPFVWTGLLAFAMGLQNALVTRISGAVVRTTHLTGIATDMGIELVRFTLWSRGELRAQRGGLARLRGLYRLFRNREFDRLWLHLRIFTSFLVGALVGPLLYLSLGAHSLGLPVLVVVCLAAFDAVRGLDPRHEQEHGEAPPGATASGTPSPDRPRP